MAYPALAVVSGVESVSLVSASLRIHLEMVGAEIGQHAMKFHRSNSKRSFSLYDLAFPGLSPPVV